MSLCIDIGGTKVLLASLGNSGEILRTKKIPTPKSYPLLIESIAQNAADLVDNTTTIVVGAPGKIDRAKNSVIAFGNLKWTNVPLGNDLEKALGRSVVIENDANLAALGEYWALPSPPHKVLYITISTGIGIGVVTDGRLDDDYIDAEVGEMLFERDGKLVFWEEIASGRAIVRQYGQLASELDDPQAWRDISHKLSIGILNLLTMIEPNIIIVGGGVGTHFKKFEHFLRDELQLNRPKLINVPPIQQASLPEQAVILGCYLLASQLDSAGG